MKRLKLVIDNLCFKNHLCVWAISLLFPKEKGCGSMNSSFQGNLICFKLGWNWLSGAEEEVKNATVQRDNRWLEKLTWAISWGVWKFFPLGYFFLHQDILVCYIYKHDEIKILEGRTVNEEDKKKTEKKNHNITFILILNASLVFHKNNLSKLI